MFHTNFLCLTVKVWTRRIYVYAKWLKQSHNLFEYHKWQIIQSEKLNGFWQNFSLSPNENKSKIKFEYLLVFVIISKMKLFRIFVHMQMHVQSIWTQWAVVVKCRYQLKPIQHYLYILFTVMLFSMFFFHSIHLILSHFSFSLFFFFLTFNPIG